MRKFAPLRAANSFLCKVGTLTHVLVLTIKAFLAVTEHCKVTAHAFARAYLDMGEWTIDPRAPSCVCEMHAQRRAFGCWVVRKRTSRVRMWAGTLEKRPADRNLCWIVAIWTREATVACALKTRSRIRASLECEERLTCRIESRTRLINEFTTMRTTLPGSQQKLHPWICLYQDVPVWSTIIR